MTLHYGNFSVSQASNGFTVFYFPSDITTLSMDPFRVPLGIVKMQLMEDAN